MITAVIITTLFTLIISYRAFVGVLREKYFAVEKDLAKRTNILVLSDGSIWVRTPSDKLLKECE